MLCIEIITFKVINIHVKSLPDNQAGTQGFWTLAGWCPRPWHSPCHQCTHIWLGCLWWQHIPPRHDSECWSAERVGGSLDQSGHLLEMVLAAVVPLHSCEMNRHCNNHQLNHLTSDRQRNTLPLSCRSRKGKMTSVHKHHTRKVQSIKVKLYNADWVDHRDCLDERQ